MRLMSTKLACANQGGKGGDGDSGEPPFSPYDEAAEALLSRPERSSERSLSTSDVVRNAVIDGDLKSAMAVIKNEMKPGGDWHEEVEDDGTTNNESTSKFGSVDYLLEQMKKNEGDADEK